MKPLLCRLLGGGGGGGIYNVCGILYFEISAAYSMEMLLDTSSDLQPSQAPALYI